MAIIKCKMCGGDLNVVEGSTVAECEYCGTRQTVPTADSEKKLTLFGRAGRLLRACEFDKAAGVFESIVAEFPEEAEAYWGLVLCKYGIEYVDDPATGKKIPTCHRSSFDSVMDDENFDQACENADAVARRLYREEAKAIEELRRGIIEVSGKEAPYDIFICYKETDENGDRTLDSVLAQDIYDALTEKGYRVFFSRVTLEDKLGMEYEPYIFAALNSAKVMLAIGTDYDHYNAVWVKNEWSRFLHLIAGGQKKTLIPCYKGIDAYDMPKEFARLQAQDLGKVGAMQDLLRGVDKLLGKGQQDAAQAPQSVAQSATGGPSVDSLLKRGEIFLGDGDWTKADEYFDKVLDIDPENAHAYFGKLLASRRVKDGDALARQGQEIEEDPLFQKALRYADESYKSELNEQNAAVQEGVRAKQEAVRMNIQRLKPLMARSAAAQKLIAAGNSHTLGFQVDGTVVAVGADGFRQCNVSGGTDTVAVAAGDNHSVVLKSDGRVIAFGDSDNGQCNVTRWSDIVGIDAGGGHTVGLKSDGTVVATRITEDKYCKDCGQSNVSDWSDITAVAAGNSHTVGLKSDGTVVAVGSNEYGQLGVFDWTNIVAIAAGYAHTVGLKSDGTVVAVGFNGDGRCNVTGWTDIVAIAARNGQTIGLKSDGTVVATGNNKNGRCNVSNWKDIVAIAAGDAHTIGLQSDGTVVATTFIEDENFKNYGQCDVSGWKLFSNIDTLKEESREARKALEEQRLRNIERLKPLMARSAAAQKRIATGGSHTLGLRSGGVVVAVGANEYGQCKTFSGSNNVAIAAGGSHSVVLKFDGWVIASGYNGNGQCDVSRWSDIVAISAGDKHTVGLKSDGTVAATSIIEDSQYKDCGQSNVSDWRNIIAVAAGGLHTVGLKSDGTVVAVGSNKYGQLGVSDWTDIVAIAAGYVHTVGLKSDGTVVAVGYNGDGRCSVSGWKDIVAIAARNAQTIGLKSDGTVVAVGNKDNGRCNVSNWKDIVAIAAGDRHAIGLKPDGTVVATTFIEDEKFKNYGQCDVSDWKLFNSMDALEKESKEARNAAEAYRRQKGQPRAAKTKGDYKREASALKAELANLHGLFSGKRRKEIEARLAEINRKLAQLK